MPHGEFGLDVIALVGVLRYHQQRSIPQIHEELQQRGLQVAERTVTDQLYRYEELLALHLADEKRLRERLKEQKQVILLNDECGRSSFIRSGRKEKCCNQTKTCYNNDYDERQTVGLVYRNERCN